MSGKVRIGIPPGRNLDVELSTLSGSIRTPFDLGGDGAGTSAAQGRVSLRSVSGDISLTNALERA